MVKLKSFGHALGFAFKTTYTIGISWMPIALAFGLIVRQSGMPYYWAGLSCILCPLGSLQMMVFSLTMSSAAWFTVLVTSVALAFRHLFYGLSFLEKFRAFGAAKHYMIYMLCDELYSVYCGAYIPSYLDEKQVYFAMALVLQLYWMVLSTLSALLGSVIPFDLTGVDFALTALFTVILIEMVLSSKTKLPLACAAVCGVSCLLLFGAAHFLIPALLTACAALLLLRRQIERSAEETAHE